ncbi:MAG: hypothetical protein H6Q69_3081 [Firmicutes bacterium]|nr:hypothetical protein [Bacillota bacterium]
MLALHLVCPGIYNLKMIPTYIEKPPTHVSGLDSLYLFYNTILSRRKSYVNFLFVALLKARQPRILKHLASLNSRGCLIIGASVNIFGFTYVSNFNFFKIISM